MSSRYRSRSRDRDRDRYRSRSRSRGRYRSRSRSRDRGRFGDPYRGRRPPNIRGMVSLKVDNLSYRITPEELKPIFERYGEVGDIYIPRDRFTKESRGFAFVRFFDRRDSEEAMDKLDGYVLDGREMRVQMARYGRPSEPPHIRYGRAYVPAPRRRSRSRSRSYSPRRRSRSYSPRRSRSRSSSRERSRSRSPKRNRSSSPEQNNRSGSVGDSKDSSKSP